MASLLELVVGTYEEIVLGFMLSRNEKGLQFKPSFTDHSHISSVRCAAISNRNVLATGGADEHIKLLNLKTRKEMGSLMQHEGTVTGICFWGRRHLVSCSEDSTVCLYDTKDWETLRTFKGHKAGVTGVAVHPSGKFMMSVSKDKALKTWDLVRGRPAFTSNIQAVADGIQFTRNGDKYLVQYQTKVDVYSLKSASVLFSLAPSFRVLTVDVTQDYALLGGEGGNVAVYSLQEGHQVCTQQLHEERLKVLRVERVAEEDFVLTACSGGSIRVWSMRKQEDGVQLEQVCSTTTKFRPLCMAVRNCSVQQRKNVKPKSATAIKVEEPVKESEDNVVMEAVKKETSKRKRIVVVEEVKKKTSKRKPDVVVEEVKKKTSKRKRKSSAPETVPSDGVSKAKREKHSLGAGAKTKPQAKSPLPQKKNRKEVSPTKESPKPEQAVAGKKKRRPKKAKRKSSSTP